MGMSKMLTTGLENKGDTWQHSKGSFFDKLSEGQINKGLYENPDDPKYRDWQKKRNKAFGLGNYAKGGYFDPENVKKRELEKTGPANRMAAIPETTEGRRGFLNKEVESRKEIWD